MNVRRLSAAALTTLIATFWGCSQSPVQPDVAVTPQRVDGTDQVELTGRLEYMEVPNAALKLVDDPREITLVPSTRFFQQTEQAKVSLSAAALFPGDSALVVCTKQSTGALNAGEIVVYTSSGSRVRSDLHVETRTIWMDYAHSQFLSTACWQFTVDSLTYIYAAEETSELDNEIAAARRNPLAEPLDSTHTRLTLADISVGDSLEIWADQAQSFSYYAVAIRRIKTSDSPIAVTFTDIITSLDANVRSVGFVGENRLGFVDWSADIRDGAGNQVMLGEFATGMRVEVHGFVESNGQIRIVSIQRRELL